MQKNRPFVLAIGLILAFATLAHAAHDLWSATLIHIATGALFVSFLVQKLRSKTSAFFQWPMMIASIVVIGAVVLAVPGAANQPDALLSFKDIFSSFLLFLIAANIFRSDSDYDLLARILVPVFWIQAIISLKQGDIRSFSDNSSTLINANLNAAVLLAWWPVILDRTLDAMARGTKIRWYWLSGFAAVLISFQLSWSLSAWAVLVVCLAFWSQQMGVSKRIVFSAAFLLVLFLLIIKIFPMVFQGQWPNSIPNRLAWWETAWTMFMHNPWRGVGLGGFPSSFLAFKVPAGENTLSPHSWFFQLLGEMGFLGIVVFCAFAVSFFQAVSRFSDKSNLQKSYFLGGTATLVYCLMNIGGEYFLIRMIVPLFLFASQSSPARTFQLRSSVVLFVFGIFVLSLPSLVSPFLASRHLVTGRLNLAAAQVDLAEKSFRVAVELDPMQWEAYQSLAHMAYQKSLFRQDLDLLSEAIRLQETAIRYNKLNGRLWWELGQYKAAKGLGKEGEADFQKARDLGFIFSSLSS